MSIQPIKSSPDKREVCFYEKAIVASDAVGKVATLTKLILDASKTKPSKVVKDALFLAKFNKLVKAPNLVWKLSESQSAKSAVFAAIALYFCLLEVRGALKWVPKSEAPYTAILGLGRIELFRQALQRYQQLVDEEDLGLAGNVKQVNAYISARSIAEYELFDSGFGMISSLAMGAQIVFPSQKNLFKQVNNLAKLAGLVFLPLLLTPIKIKS